MQQVSSILPGISDHDIVQIQVNTSAKILFQKPRSISTYKKANWDGMKQALEAYHQDMLESGKYSSLNAVQLWDDLHSILTSLTNKFIPSKLSNTRNNLHWVNLKFKWIAKQRDRAFQKQRKSGKPADRKKNLDLKHLFRKSIKLSYQSYLEDILDVASNDLTSKPNTKKLLHFSNIPNKILPLLHLYTSFHNSVHQDDPMKATILNEQFQSVLSRKSPNSLSSRWHMKLQESTDADRSMLDITVTSKGIEKLLSNLNPHKAAGPDQIKPCYHPKKPFNPTITNPKTSLPKVARLGNLITNLEGCLCSPCLQKR